MFYDVAARKSWAERARVGEEGFDPSRAALAYSDEVRRAAEEAYDAEDKASSSSAQPSRVAGSGEKGRGKGDDRKRGRDNSWSSWGHSNKRTWWDASNDSRQAAPSRIRTGAPVARRRICDARCVRRPSRRSDCGRAV